MKAREKICFALDVNTISDAKYYVSELADYVGWIKIGMEAFYSRGPSILRGIEDHNSRSLSKLKIMLDLKLHDIPTTVARAAAALHKQHEFNLLTAHCGDSPNALIKLAEHIDVNKIVGITVLTSVDWNGIHNYHGANFNLDELIVRRVMSAHVNAGVNKFVCSGRDLPKLRKSLDESSPYPGVKFITPGVRSLKPTDDQARVTTPTRAIKNGSWLLVIGREIRDAENPINAAAKIHNDVMEAMSDE